MEDQNAINKGIGHLNRAINSLNKDMECVGPWIGSLVHATIQEECPSWCRGHNLIPFNPIGPYLASVGLLPIKMTIFPGLFDDHISYSKPMNMNIASMFSYHSKLSCALHFIAL